MVKFQYGGRRQSCRRPVFLRVNLKHPFRRNVGHATGDRRLKDGSLPSGRDAPALGPLVNGLEVRADFLSESAARGPAVDQVLDGVVVLHTPNYGRFFQKDKVEKSTMAVFLIESTIAP